MKQDETAKSKRYRSHSCSSRMVRSHLVRGFWGEVYLMGAKKIPAEKKHMELWTFEELKSYLKVPRATLFMYIATDKIPSIKIGRHRRFIPEEVLKAIRKLPA